MEFRVRGGDAALAVFLILITAMLLAPLPTVALDFLLVLNLAFSLLLLLAGLYLPNALALLAFPSILLLTTLFRLSLNVASTRLILSQGDAGQVIASFGTFLIRGEIVVGLIIFLILTVVNFIVVAKGAARVSEVAARFALDALPGKQMAIDSDLRAGLITAAEAQRRREDIRKESQLYGSMDGAMKFVQGDAIAGLFIIATNIIGGIYLGLGRDLSLSEAIQTYTTLTVGDGLVHQIPAILISITAGMVVTRVSAGEGSSLGSELQAQVFARPGTLLFTGLLLVLIGLTPGLPVLPFAAVGVALAGYGALKARGRAEATLWEFAGGTNRSVTALPPAGLAPGLPAPAGEEGRDSSRTILVVTLDAGYLYDLYTHERQRFHRWWQSFQADFYSETGLSIPPVRFVSDVTAAPGAYSVTVHGTNVIEGRVPLDAVLAEVNPACADIFGLEVLEEVAHPVGQSRVFWTPRTDDSFAILEGAGTTPIGPLEYIALQVGSFFVSAPEELLSIAEVLELETELEETYPGLITRSFNREFFGPARLTELLQQLVREGISIRDLKSIMESVAAFCSTLDPQRLADGDYDLSEAVAFIRASRKRHVIGRYLTRRKSLRVVLLDEMLEELFESSLGARNAIATGLPPDKTLGARKTLSAVVEPAQTRGAGTLVVLCRGDLRVPVFNFIQGHRLSVPVVTFDELDSSVTLEPVGTWRGDA